MRTLALSLFFTCTFASTCLSSGYTILTWEQPTTPYVSVLRPGGVQQWVPNRGTAPERPPTALRQVCEPRNTDSPDPLLRSEVWEDSAGSATSAELFAACPQIREAAAKRIRAEGARRLTVLAGAYTAAERETWHVQQAEAQAYQADPGCLCPMVRTMAAARGVPVGSLAAAIMENVTLLRIASGQILGEQQRLLDLIETETDFAALLAITWPATM
jgi:hypothetical protein